MQIPVTGMTCQSCAQTIEKAISELPGARNVNVNFTLKQLSVDGISFDDAVKTLRSVGYGTPAEPEENVFQISKIDQIAEEETRAAWKAFILAALFGIPEFVIGMGWGMGQLPFPVPNFIQAFLSG